MKIFFWKLMFCFHLCLKLKTLKFWKWWFVGSAFMENDPDYLDWPPSDAVNEELSYWTD